MKHGELLGLVAADAVPFLNPVVVSSLIGVASCIVEVLEVRGLL